MGGCLHNATWLQAEARCRQYGARLCTRAELPVNQNSGCGHDAEYVWTWDECAHQTPPFRCAFEGDSCQCAGMVYYGRRFDPTTGNELMNISSMQQYPSFNRSITSSVTCHNAEFGDPAPAAEKHCICELAAVSIERRVAANGGYVEDYQCDDWTLNRAVRCCAP